MKNETPKKNYIGLIGLAFISGFIYFKWENVLDFINNFINFKDSHPNNITSFEKFLTYLEDGDIKKVDLYENGEIVVFDLIDSISYKLQHISVKVPIRNSSLILKLREYQIDFTAHMTSSCIF